MKHFQTLFVLLLFGCVIQKEDIHTNVSFAGATGYMVPSGFTVEDDPAIQPDVSVGAGNYSIEAWANHNLNTGKISEMDGYLNANWKWTDWALEESLGRFHFMNSLDAFADTTDLKSQLFYTRWPLHPFATLRLSDNRNGRGAYGDIGLGGERELFTRTTFFGDLRVGAVNDYFGVDVQGWWHVTYQLGLRYAFSPHCSGSLKFQSRTAIHQDATDDTAAVASISWSF